MNTNSSEDEAKELETRQWRYMRLAWLRQHTTIKRVESCLWHPTGSTVGVRTAANSQGVTRAHYTNVQRCASVHVCPVCAPQIRAGRAEEIRAGLENWLNEGRGATFATFTIPHGLSDTLADTLAALNMSIKKLRQHRDYRGMAETYGIVWSVTALDMTHGASSWHPHLHIVLGTKKPLRSVRQYKLQKRLRRLWVDVVRRVWGREVNYYRGVLLERVKDSEGIGAYLSKVALEVGRSDLKRRGSGRNPWELLELAAHEGDEEALALWNEYELATLGKRLVRWSHGARALLGLGEELTDEELLEVGGVDRLSIPVDVSHPVTGEKSPNWAVLRSAPGRSVAFLAGVEEWVNTGSTHAGLEELAYRFGVQVLLVENSPDLITQRNQRREAAALVREARAMAATALLRRVQRRLD